MYEPRIAEGVFIPACPDCDWLGTPTANSLTALGRSDAHQRTHTAKAPDPVDLEPLTPFAAAVRENDET